MNQIWIKMGITLIVMLGLSSCGSMDSAADKSDAEGTDQFVVENVDQMDDIELADVGSEAAARYAGGSGRTLQNMDVILIRGYTSDVMFDASMPKWSGLGDAVFNNYWYGFRNSTYFGYMTDTILKTRYNGSKVMSIAWSSRDRLSTGILTSLIEQIQDKMSHQGLCQNGCIMVTHSTGGLVSDYLLAESKRSAGTGFDFSNIYNQTYMAVHVASAAGGSELAQLARDVAYGGCTALSSTIMSWLFKGIDCNEGGMNIGVTHDLVPSAARAINQSSLTSTPSLMVAGEGTAGFAGAVSAPILPGNDDSVVAMHSACGATSANGIESCSSKINITWTSNGGYGGYYSMKRDCVKSSWGICTQYSSYYEDNVTTGPSGLYSNHYPWIMSEADHGEIIGHRDYFSPTSGDDGHVDVLVTKDSGGANAYMKDRNESYWDDWLGYDYRDLSDDGKDVPTLIRDHLSF